jgi:hypothetical protein
MPLLTSIIAASRRRVDPDAADYFARIVAAGSTISEPNKVAVNAFVAGCKADGIWAAIKASCLLAGPDDLTGALVPLVGAAPTNFNFVAGDYNRVTGLVGDGSTKYLNSNRNNNADPQNDNHNAVFVTGGGATGNAYMGAGVNSTGTNVLGTGGGVRSRNSNLDTSTSNPVLFFGMSRDTSSEFIVRSGSSNLTKSRDSQTPFDKNIGIFASFITAPILYTNGRLSFYSIGESLDLAALDARLTTYMSSLT